MYKVCVYDEAACRETARDRNNHCSNCAKNAIFKNNVALFQRATPGGCQGRPERPADCLYHELKGVTLTLKRITELKGMNEPRDDPPPTPHPKINSTKLNKDGRWTQ